MPDIVSPNLKARIDFRILLGIFIGVVLFQFYLNFLDNEEQIEVSIIGVSLSSQIIAGIAALIVSKKYHGSKVFGRSFISLASAFFSLAIGETIYNVSLFVFNVDPFPSVADIFFFLLYPFALVHLIINIKFFRIKNNLKDISLIIGLVLSIILLYSFLAFDAIGEFNIDFFYGIIFISGASLITSIGVYASIRIRKIPLGRSWVLLVAGILLGTIGDIWYQYLEILGEYGTAHVVNLFWYASYLVIIYSLYKHYKII